MGDFSTKLEIPKDFYLAIQEYGNHIAAKLAQKFATELTNEYRYMVEYFYASYTQKKYKRKWQLRKSYHRYYKNPHGTRVHGGVKISAEDMLDVHHDSPEEVLSTSLMGYHGRIEKGIYIPPEIYDHMLQYRLFLWNNAEAYVDEKVTNYTYENYSNPEESYHFI